MRTPGRNVESPCLRDPRIHRRKEADGKRLEMSSFPRDIYTHTHYKSINVIKL